MNGKEAAKLFADAKSDAQTPKKLTTSQKRHARRAKNRADHTTPTSEPISAFPTEPIADPRTDEWGDVNVQWPDHQHFDSAPKDQVPYPYPIQKPNRHDQFTPPTVLPLLPDPQPTAIAQIENCICAELHHDLMQLADAACIAKKRVDGEYQVPGLVYCAIHGRVRINGFYVRNVHGMDFIGIQDAAGKIIIQMML